MITLYARKEPSKVMSQYDDSNTLNDVQIYSDEKALQPKARFTWWSINKPDRRNKYITLNCYRWRIIWLPDLKRQGLHTPDNIKQEVTTCQT